MSAKDPLTCEFLKVKAFHLLVRDSYKLGKNDNASKKDKSDIYDGHCKEIKDYFNGLKSFCFDSKFHSRSLIAVQKILIDIGRTASDKTNFGDFFEEYLVQVVRECEAIKNASAINRYIINFI